MKILYIASYQYFGSHHAGFTHTYSIADHIGKSGHEVHLLIKPGTLKDCKIHNNNRVRIHFMNMPSRTRHFPIYWISIARSIPKITALVNEHDIDLIHERFRVPGGIGVTNGKLLGIPCVLEVNYPYLKEQFKNKFVYYAIKSNQQFQFKLCSGIITQTEILKNTLSTNRPIAVIPNGADTSLFNPNKIDPKIASRFWGKKVVGYVGSYQPWHGVPDLLKAFKYVRDKISSCKLMLIGGDPIAISKMKRIADKLNILNDVEFVGSVPHEKVPYYLSVADVCVAPFNTSYQKTVFMKYGMWYSPLKIFEYMSMAKPVVCPNIGVFAEYLKNSGVTYDEGNVKELADKIVLLLQNGHLASELGRNGRKRVETWYTWQIQAQRTIEFYRQILNR